MSQYMYLSTSESAFLEVNVALEDLLKFIGKEYKNRHSSIRIHNMSDYDAGVEWLNKKCKYYHKNTIKRMIRSKHKKTGSGIEYRQWRFHRRKAVTVLNRLHWLLNDCNAPEQVKEVFKKLYKKWKYEYDLHPLGSEITSLPYNNEIYDAISDREREEYERIAFSNIFNAFDKYNSFFRGI